MSRAQSNSKGKKKLRTSWLQLNLISAFVALLAVYFQGTSVAARMEYLLEDIYFALRGPISPPKELVIVSVDRKSYEALGVSPFSTLPRKYIAELLKVLAQERVKGVVFDTIFAGPSDDPAGDDALAQALQNPNIAIVGDAGIPKEIDLGTRLVPYQKFSAAKVGHVRLFPEFGVVRRFGRLWQKEYQPLSVVGASFLGDAQKIPDGTDLINYYGEAESIPSIPIYKVLKGEFKAGDFKDKLVFVGWGMKIEGPGQAKDSFAVPTSKSTVFGVEIQATLAANIIDGSYIKNLFEPLRENLRLLFIGVFLVTMAALSLKPQGCAIFLGGLVSIWACVSYSFFLKGVFVPGLGLVALFVPPIIVGNSLHYYLVITRSRRIFENALSQYVSPMIAAKLAKSEDFDFDLDTVATVTMMLTDIQGFTSWAEEHKGRETLRALNRYFIAIAGVVLDNEGTVIKYIGDGMFALWGAPLDVSEPSRKAVSAALLIQEKLKKLIDSGDLPNFKTRIGIHREEVALGNLGEARKLDYTAVGDGVNITARLEELNKKFGTSIIISEVVYREVAQFFECESLGQVEIRGRKEPVRVYSVKGLSS